MTDVSCNEGNEFIVSCNSREGDYKTHTFEAKADLWSNNFPDCAFTQRLNLGTFGNRLVALFSTKTAMIPTVKHPDDEALKTPYVHIITWISWILLKPSLQKNSTRLDKVLGPGISFSVLVFPRTSVGAISLSATASSPAAVIPNVSLAADLCKTRKTKNICLLSRSPWKFLQHAVVNVLRMAIVVLILLGDLSDVRLGSTAAFYSQKEALSSNLQMHVRGTCKTRSSPLVW